jgi:adenosylcobinamide kinase/adenosylcobinamide-phosphate guanylyltransferase
MSEIYLVVGGTRSGKSRFAEAFFQNKFPKGGIYLSTAQAFNDEMQARIDHHQQLRLHSNYAWQTVENENVCDSLIKYSSLPILLDCLTIGLSNVLWQLNNRAEMTDAATIFRQKFMQNLSQRQAPIVIVSNEVGLSLVSESLLGRVFTDEIGWLHQEIGKIAQEVFMVSAGIPIALKSQAYKI